MQTFLWLWKFFPIKSNRFYPFLVLRNYLSYFRLLQIMIVFFSFILLYWFHCTITFSYRDCLIMINAEYQHQCSSNAIAYNTSIFYKLRKSYLIIDIEPTVDKSQHPSDRSYSAIIKDYYHCEYICLSTNIRHTLWNNHFSCYFGWLILAKRRRMTLNRVILFFFLLLYMSKGRIEKNNYHGDENVVVIVVLVMILDWQFY